MDAQAHWNKIYAEQAQNAVSWYRPHLERSLSLIEQLAPERSASIIDVGGGESTLVDDLLASGYERITVLDISKTAVEANRERLGFVAERVVTACMLAKSPLLGCLGTEDFCLLASGTGHAARRNDTLSLMSCPSGIAHSIASGRKRTR